MRFLEGTDNLIGDDQVALAHHWTFSRRGGERVLEQIAELFPGACLYMLACDRDNLVPDLRRRSLHATLLQSLPWVSRIYRHVLPLHPILVRSLKVDPKLELLITSDAALMKTIRKPASAKHICYCHSPPRYLWGMQEEYARASRLTQLGLSIFGDYLRQSDRMAADDVDQFVANSVFVQNRIRTAYGRESVVIYPPVETQRFNPGRRREPFYLVVSELVGYKRVDLAIQACNRNSSRLIVVGGGPEAKSLQESAGPTIEFKGRCTDDEVASLFERARAFLMPGLEDFGITPVESQAAGCPVIALGSGGAIETVIDGATGVHFHEQTVDSLCAALERFESLSLSSQACRWNAERFGQDRFKVEFAELVEQVVSGHRSNGATRRAA